MTSLCTDYGRDLLKRAGDKMISKTLEQKTEKINWKEWIPVYGIYQRIMNQKETKLNATDEISRRYTAYQTISTIALSAGLYKLGEIILK